MEGSVEAIVPSDESVESLSDDEMDESLSLWSIDGTVDMLLSLEEEEESSLLLSSLPSLLLYIANPDPSAGERAPSPPLFIKA